MDFGHYLHYNKCNNKKREEGQDINDGKKPDNNLATFWWEKHGFVE
jgi:hypothetical protein